MKTPEQISQDILVSLGQSTNPVGVLLEGYLSSVIREIVKDQLIEFQQYLADDDLITTHDWSFNDEANKFLDR
jgi:hypothetical protein